MTPQNPQDCAAWRDRTGNRLPDTAGVGFKFQHTEDALAPMTGQVGWMEIHPETYMVDGGPRLRILDAIAEAYPISLHGVALSLAGEAPPDSSHLARLKALVERVRPAQVSEHLAWADHGGVYFADLLPIQLTRATLDRVVRNVEIAQDYLGRRILVENPSHYLVLPGAELTEIELLCRMVERTGCGLLVDVNNVFITQTNVGHRGFGDAMERARQYLDALPGELIGEIHLAGHSVDPADGRNLLIDDHGAPVADPVWSLFEHLIARIGPRPSLIEWDNNVPDWTTLTADAGRADAVLRRHRFVGQTVEAAQ
jgi:hypothetical protein